MIYSTESSAVSVSVSDIWYRPKDGLGSVCSNCKRSLMSSQLANDTCVIGVHTTPVGSAWSVWTADGLARLSFEPVKLSDASDSESRELRREAERFDRLLAKYYRDGRETFADVRVDLSHVTPFSLRVYKACRAIPAGETRTYGELAVTAGSPGASRAVGSAMARNRVPIVIPCHRVVGASGRLCGFSAPGGLETKQSLLDLERQGKAKPSKQSRKQPASQ